MKLKWMAGVAAAAMFAAGAAQAEPDGWYGAIDLGYHWPDAEAGFVGFGTADFDLENSWTGFARLGYRFNPNWRFELEGGYRPGDSEEPGVLGEVKVWSVMGNIIWDFMPDSQFSPFIGVGAGWARTSADLLDAPAVIVDDTDSDFAWQALAGFSWELGERTNLDFTYRYFDGGEPEFGNLAGWHKRVSQRASASA